MALDASGTSLVHICFLVLPFFSLSLSLCVSLYISFAHFSLVNKSNAFFIMLWIYVFFAKKLVMGFMPAVLALASFLCPTDIFGF